MIRHPERRLPGQPNPPTAPKGPQFREVTRFSGVYLKEIWQRVNEYDQFYPDGDRDELVQTISLEASEQPRVNRALDALNQLSVLGIKKGEIGSRVRTFVVQQMTPPGRAVYDVTWAGVKPESLAKPKEPSKTSQLQSPTLHGQPMQVAYPFKTQAQRIQAQNERDTQSDKEPRRENRHDRRKRQRREVEELERQAKERAAIEDVIIDRGRELGELHLEKQMIKIELGKDNEAVILYRPLFRTNPDGTPKYAEVDRATGHLPEDDILFYDRVFRPDMLRYFEVKAQTLEGKVAEPYSPFPLTPDELQDVYDRALQAEIIRVECTPQSGVEFYYLVLLGFMQHKYYGKMDLERMIVEPTEISQKEQPLNPQFAEFLRLKKAELESSQSALTA